MVRGRRFPHLLRRPFLDRVFVYMKVQHARRACTNTTNPNRIRKVAVGTTKK
jgi:hypothetical protein